MHEFNSHGGGDFGYGAYIIAHIEGILGQLKGLLKKIYNTNPQKHFIYYLREAEFRININIKAKNSNEEKFNLFCEMSKFIIYN